MSLAQSLLNWIAPQPDATPMGRIIKRLVAGNEQNILRPFSATTHCGKILAAMERGQRMTSLSAFAICGAVSADRRVREVTKRLRAEGRPLQERWIKTKGGARVKEYWLDDPKNCRRKRVRGGR
ncbi:helix-turn-helix domain-containing protein [Rhizobium phaseoli]|uniref:helix-turn-helix domain-containing protein n=1 Tax=Rhizobium phaseoli TaxID=396 RepID=UPI0007EAF396|nr:helix-turn-helix domain-containing protein [Rhizobium phaseoli]ANL71915.1 helix-turn-helix domain-containing protein [Rhizobium phaseoli]